MIANTNQPRRGAPHARQNPATATRPAARRTTALPPSRSARKKPASSPTPTTCRRCARISTASRGKPRRSPSPSADSRSSRSPPGATASSFIGALTRRANSASAAPPLTASATRADKTGADVFVSECRYQVIKPGIIRRLDDLPRTTHRLSKPGFIVMPAPGVLGELEIPDSKALTLLAECLYNFTAPLMRACLRCGGDMRQFVADCLLLAEAVLFREGTDYVVEIVGQEGNTEKYSRLHGSATFPKLGWTGRGLR